MIENLFLIISKLNFKQIDIVAGLILVVINNNLEKI